MPNLFVFGSTKGSNRWLNERVSSCVTDLECSLDIYAFVGLPVDYRIARLMPKCGLRPATTSCLSQNVAVIISVDYSWRFVSGKIVRLTDDLAPVETILGWVVQGFAPVVSSTRIPATMSPLCCAMPCPSWLTCPLGGLGIAHPVAGNDEAEAGLEISGKNAKSQVRSPPGARVARVKQL